MIGYHRRLTSTEPLCIHVEFTVELSLKNAQISRNPSKQQNVNTIGSTLLNRFWWFKERTRFVPFMKYWILRHYLLYKTVISKTHRAVIPITRYYMYLSYICVLCYSFFSKLKNRKVIPGTTHKTQPTFIDDYSHC